MNYYDAEINKVKVKIKTNESIFSPHHIDQGTLHMLSLIELKPDDKVLDLGCGAGVVGIYCAKIIGAENVTMSDVDPIAVEVAQSNAQLNQVDGVKIIISNGFNELHETKFSVILSNPPYHTDFSVAKHFIEKGFNRLEIGGAMYMVTKRKEWYKNKLIGIFGGVKIHQMDDYYIYKAIKKTNTYRSKKQKK